MTWKTLDKLLATNSVKDIAERLNLATGTVKRWVDTKNVPPSYRFELTKMDGGVPDYSQFTTKEKDQFFTPTDVAVSCIQKFHEVCSKWSIDTTGYRYIEPSAGAGAFYGSLPPGSIGMDIEPRCEGVSQQDFLSWVPPDPNGKYVVAGNPPFGLRGQLALKFMNHAATFADHIFFILPQLFESDGKGSPRKRVKGYNLIHSEKLTTKFEVPDGHDTKVNCVFQVWSRLADNPEYHLIEPPKDIIEVFSLSAGGTPSSTRNKDKWDKCDIYIPSTCYGEDNMKAYKTMWELPGHRGYGVVFHRDKDHMKKKFLAYNWSGNAAFLSTNSALNMRTSQIYTAIMRET
jgi:hypothetical protein